MTTKQWASKILDENPFLTSIYGEYLKPLQGFLPQFDEFKGKTIHIIEKLEMNPEYDFSNESVKVTANPTPKVITCVSDEATTDIFNDTINLYAIGIMNDQVFYIATPDSFK